MFLLMKLSLLCLILIQEKIEKYTQPQIKNIKILAAIGDNILISEWVKDNEHVNYYDAVNDKLAKNYYINNSGKVLYELD